MIRHKVMFKGFLIITALCLGTPSEAGNNCIWCDDKVSEAFMNCCTQRMANNPNLKTCASSFEEMKTDLLEAAKAMKKNGPTKEDVMKGAMAYPIVKCLANTGGNPNEKISVTRKILRRCYRDGNIDPDEGYINEVCDMITDEMLKNGDPSSGQQPKKDTQSDEIAQTDQNISPLQYSNSPPQQVAAGPNQEKNQWNFPYDKMQQQGQNFQPNPSPGSTYAIPSGTDQQRPSSLYNAYFGNQRFNPLNMNNLQYNNPSAYLGNVNQNQPFNPSNANNQQYNNQGNPNSYQIAYQNTPNTGTSAPAASQTAYKYPPQNYDSNSNSYAFNEVATSSASASSINDDGNNAASSSSGPYSIDNSNPKSSPFDNNIRKEKQKLLTPVNRPQSVSSPQNQQNKWDNNQSLYPEIQNIPIRKPEPVKTSSVHQQTSPFATQNVAQDNNWKINNQKNVPSTKDDKDAMALRFSKTLYEIFIHDVFFKIVFHEYLTKYQSKILVPYILHNGFISCGYGEKTAQEFATKSITLMDGFPEQSSTSAYAEAICKMLMVQFYRNNLIDDDPDGQATDLGNAISKALGKIVRSPPDQDNDPKPVVLPVSKQPLPDYPNKGIPYDDSNPIYDAAKPQVKPDSFSNKQKPVVLPEFEKNLPDYLKEFVPYDDNNLNYDVANTEVKPDSFSDTPVDLPAYEQNSPDYPITSVHYDDGNPNYDAANPKVKPDSFSNKQLNKKSDLLIKGSDYSLPQTLPIQNQKNRPKVYDISNQPTDDKAISYYKPEKNKNKNKADQSYVAADDKTGYGSDYNDSDVPSGQWQYQKQKNQPNNKGNSDQSPDDKPISYDKTSKNKSNKKDKTVYSTYNDKNQPTNSKQNKKRNQQSFGSTDGYYDDSDSDDYDDLHYYYYYYPKINAKDGDIDTKDYLDYEKREQSPRKDYNVNDNSKDTPKQRPDTLIQKADSKTNKQGDNNPDTYNVPYDNSKTTLISKTLGQQKNKSNSLYLPDYNKDGGQKPSKQPSLLPPIADDQQNSKLSDIAQKNISKAPVKPETSKNSDLAHTPDNQTDLGTGAPGFQPDNSMNPDLNKAKNDESKASVEILKKSALDCMKGEEFDYKTFSHVIAELAKILQQNHPDWGKQECQKTVLIQALYVLAQLLLKSNVKEVKGILQQPQKIFEPMQLPPNSQQNNQNEPQKDQNPNYQPGQTNKKSQPVIQDKPTVDYLAPEQNIAYRPQNQELQQKKWDNNPNSYSVIPNTPTPQQKPVNANYVPQQTNPSANQPSAQNNNWYITNQEWQSSLPQRNNNNEYSPLRGQQDPVPGQVNLNPGNGKWNDKLFSAPQTGNSNIPYTLQNQQIQPNRLDSNKNSYPLTKNPPITQQNLLNRNYLPQQNFPIDSQPSAQNNYWNSGNEKWQNNPQQMNSNNVNSEQMVQPPPIPGQVSTNRGNGKGSDKIFPIPQPMNKNVGVPDNNNFPNPLGYQANWRGLQQNQVNNPIVPQNGVQGNWDHTSNGPNNPIPLRNGNSEFIAGQGNWPPIPNGPSSPNFMKNGYPSESQGIGSVSQTDVSSQIYQWNRKG